MDNLPKNILLAVVSTGTYYATICNKKDALQHAATFGAINGLAQQIVPNFITDEAIQSVIIDPLIATIANTALKVAVDPTRDMFQEFGRSLVAGISGSALTNYAISGHKSW